MRVLSGCALMGLLERLCRWTKAKIYLGISERECFVLSQVDSQFLSSSYNPARKAAVSMASDSSVDRPVERSF